MERVDLDALRSIPELASYQKEVQERLTELNAEHAGLPFPDEDRAEFAGLTEQDQEINDRIRELETRHRTIARFAEDPTRVERENAELDRRLQSREAQGSSREHDIYDLSRMNIDPTDPDRAREEYRDRAMRAIEVAHFPQRLPDGRPIDKARTQGHIEHLMRSTQEGEPEAPQPGAVARHILTTGSPAYRRAFWKQLAGRVLTREEQRALSLGGSGGGFAIPFALDPTLVPISNSVVKELAA